MPKLIGSWCGRWCEASTAGSMGPGSGGPQEGRRFGGRPRRLREPGSGALRAAASGARGAGRGGAPGPPGQLHPSAPAVAAPMPASAGRRGRNSHPGGARPTRVPGAPFRL